MDKTEKNHVIQSEKTALVKKSSFPTSVGFCPDCGSKNYVGNSFGGHCLECGCRWGWCQ